MVLLLLQEKSKIWLLRRIPEGVIIILPKGRFRELKRVKNIFYLQKIVFIGEKLDSCIIARVIQLHITTLVNVMSLT